jgi:hypothetical protein
MMTGNVVFDCLDVLQLRGDIGQNDVETTRALTRYNAAGRSQQLVGRPASGVGLSLLYEFSVLHLRERGHRILRNHGSLNRPEFFGGSAAWNHAALAAAGW